MDGAHKKYLASVDARIASAKYSTLAMAAPLESSNSYSSKPRHSTPDAKKPKTEKVKVDARKTPQRSEDSDEESDGGFFEE